MSKFDLKNIEVQGSFGLDAFLEREPSVVTPTKTARRKVASLQDLAGFTRLSNDTLVHKSDQDLWSIQKDADGSLYVERMFSDDGTPLKV